MIGMFVCVFSEQDKDVMLAKGYYLVDWDDKNSVYVLNNEECNDVECFSLDGIKHAYTNKITL